MDYVIGMDGGGTKTEAAALSGTGKVLVCLKGKASNPHAVGADEAVRNLAALLADVRLHPSLKGYECQAVSLGLAGVDAPEERSFMESALHRELRQLGMNVPLFLGNDAEILLGSTGSPSGTVVISGTGSLVYGITHSGHRQRVGGWGHLLGDEGSGYELGLSTLQAVMNSYDGVEPPTSLTERIVHEFGFNSITDLKSYIYQPDIRKEHIAAFARFCVEEGEHADEKALSLLRTSAARLFRQTEALLEKNQELQAAPLVLAGSVFHHSSVFYESFTRSLKQAYPSIPVHTPLCSPAVSAAWLARHRLAQLN